MGYIKSPLLVIVLIHRSTITNSSQIFNTYFPPSESDVRLMSKEKYNAYIKSSITNYKNLFILGTTLGR